MGRRCQPTAWTHAGGGAQKVFLLGGSSVPGPHPGRVARPRVASVRGSGLIAPTLQRHDCIFDPLICSTDRLVGSIPAIGEFQDLKMQPSLERALSHRDTLKG